MSEQTAPAGEPSMRVVSVADPVAEASAYAQRLGADVAGDRAAVQQAIEARAGAARRLRDEPPPDGVDVDDLLARASSIRAAATAPPVSEADLARLRLLAAELARAERIRAHTKVRFDERQAASRANPAGLAVHPETILDAAASVVEAETALDRAAQALATADLAPLPFDDEPAPTGWFANVVAKVRERLGATAPEPRQSHRAGASTEPIDEHEPDALLAARDEAEEQVRQARQRWHQLAGRDADPYEPDAAVRVHDPQLAYDDDDVPAESPTVLAVAAFHRKAQARWRVLWASVGGGEPPEPEQLDLALEGLAGRRRRAAADLVHLERAERRAAATVVLTRPLVIVEPGRWYDADTLRRLLSGLPPRAQVIVLERWGAGRVS